MKNLLILLFVATTTQLSAQFTTPVNISLGNQTTITTGLTAYRNNDPNLGIKILVGDGDDASYAHWSGGFGSWNGIGFHSTIDNVTRGVFNVRTGSFSLHGDIDSKGYGSFERDLAIGRNAMGPARIAVPSSFTGAIEIMGNAAAGGATNRNIRLGFVWAGTFNPALSVNEDLKVGIGTTTPDHLLTVKGTVHCREVLVDMNGATGYDYVFEKTYDLPDLKTIEKYIEANKHLPGIPSAKEMEANGVKLLEMNLQLLKKVEELTLYVIDQQKKIELLESKVN